MIYGIAQMKLVCFNFKPTDQVRRMILKWKLNENLGNAKDDHYVAS